MDEYIKKMLEKNNSDKDALNYSKAKYDYQKKLFDNIKKTYLEKIKFPIYRFVNDYNSKVSQEKFITLKDDYDYSYEWFRTTLILSSKVEFKIWGEYLYDKYNYKWDSKKFDIENTEEEIYALCYVRAGENDEGFNLLFSILPDLEFDLIVCENIENEPGVPPYSKGLSIDKMKYGSNKYENKFYFCENIILKFKELIAKYN